MVKHNQDGVSTLALSFALCLMLLIGSIVFGAWAYMSRQDYKNNVNGKINVAVAAAIKSEDVVKDNYYAQLAKLPLATFNGPSQYGSIIVHYPKTWSAYVDDTGTGSNLLDGYFNPGFVPSISAQGSQFALRVQLLNQTYASILQNYSSQQGVSKATAYALPKVPSVVGVEITGQINSGSTENGTMVILPLRSNTLEIWTQGNTYLADFNNSILPNFSFSP